MSNYKDVVEDDCSYVIAKVAVLKAAPDGVIFQWREVGKDPTKWHDLPKSKYMKIDPSMERKATRKEYLEWVLTEET